MQTQFDFGRAEQLGMVERWQPPPIKGIRGSTVKHVLRAIDSHGRGREAWPSEATLAKETGYSVRTVIRSIQALEQMSLLVIERKGRLTLNHYRIVWSELALRCDIDAQRCDIGAQRCDTDDKRCDTASLETTEKQKQETTTTGVDPVVVELEKVLAKAAQAVKQARARGLGDDAIRERYQRWRELPEASRLPGVLYNWIALDGSYTPPQVEAKPVGRGDALSKSQIAGEVLRMRIVRAGRAAGVSQEAIERRLQQLGV